MSGLTDEQRAFASAVEDFCRREAGTRQQRDALMNQREIIGRTYGL